MSLLTICQRVAKKAGYPAPATIISNTSQTAERLLECATEAGEALAKKDWAILQREHTFSTVDTQAAYDLPSDFDHFLIRTQWNRSTKRRVYQSRPETWQAIKSGFIASTIDDRFRIKYDSGENKYFLDPTPSSIETQAYEYVSKNWCKSSGGTTQDDWAADTDVGLIDEYLIRLDTLWRFKAAVELPYIEEKDEAERQIDTAFSRDGGSRVLNMGRPEFIIGAANVPETGVGQ